MAKWLPSKQCTCILTQPLNYVSTLVTCMLKEKKKNIQNHTRVLQQYKNEHWKKDYMEVY